MVRLTRAAEKDMEAIYAYYAAGDPDLAGRVVRTIMGASEDLDVFPLLGRTGTVEGTREWVLTRYPYRIIYRVIGDNIFVARIRHHRQK